MPRKAQDRTCLAKTADGASCRNTAQADGACYLKSHRRQVAKMDVTPPTTAEALAAKVDAALPSLEAVEVAAGPAPAVTPDGSDAPALAARNAAVDEFVRARGLCGARTASDAAVCELPAGHMGLPEGHPCYSPVHMAAMLAEDGPFTLTWKRADGAYKREGVAT